MNHVLWTTLAALCLGMTILPAAAADDLRLTIGLEKSEFLRAEPIIVTSRLTNVGHAAVTVKQPSHIALAVQFTFTGPSDDPATEIREYSSRHTIGIGAPGYRPAVITLQPQESDKSTCELLRVISERIWLPLGEYTLWATYHLRDWEDPEYATDFIESNRVHFSVIEPQGEEKQAFEELQEYQALKSYPAATPERRREFLHEFLAKWERSVYRVPFLAELVQLEFSQQDWERLAQAYSQLRRERISETKRDIIKRVEADLLVRKLDRLAEAVQVLEGAKLPEAVRLRERLLEKWREQQGDAPLAVLQPDASVSDVTVEVERTRSTGVPVKYGAIALLAVAACAIAGFRRWRGRQ